MLTGIVPAFAETAVSTEMTGKVRFVTAYKGSQGMDGLIADFNKLYPNVEVKLLQISNTNEGNIQIDTMLMAGEIDVLSSYTLPRTLSRVDSLVDLRDLLARDGLDMAKEWGAEVEMNGGLYGIPFDGLTTFTTDPNWRIAIERKIQAENEEKIWKSLVEYTGDGSKTQDVFFQGGIASFVTCNVWRFAVDQANYPHDFKVGFAPYPTISAGDPTCLAGPSLFAYACIAKNCKNLDAVWAFTKFIATEGDKYLLKAGHSAADQGAHGVSGRAGTGHLLERLLHPPDLPDQQTTEHSEQWYQGVIGGRILG